MASWITSLTFTHECVYPDTDERKHQSSTSLAFVRGIHRWPVNSPQRRASNVESVSIYVLALCRYLWLTYKSLLFDSCCVASVMKIQLSRRMLSVIQEAIVHMDITSPKLRKSYSGELCLVERGKKKWRPWVGGTPAVGIPMSLPVLINTG